jgi:hypothetical protein
MVNNIRTGLVGLLGAVALAFGMSGSVKADEGELRLYNSLDSGFPKVIVGNYDGANDLSWMSPPSGNPGIYSIQGSQKLNENWEASNNTEPFKIALVYIGGVSSPLENYLELEFPWAPDYTFGTQPLSLRELDSSGNPISGKAWDIRDVIANHSGKIDLNNLAAGSYDGNSPYATYQVDFQPVNGVPEPSTLALGLAGAGLGLAGYLGKRRNRGKELRAENRRATRV